jgi:predicted TIM-barrel fold metal-dependent hydrolase
MTDLAQLRLSDYRPVPSLSAPSHRVERACTPVIDAHTHLGRWLTGGTWAVPSVTRLAELMDSCNIAAVVNMDGRWGAELEANLDRYDRRYPGRFATFCHVDWGALADGGPGRLAASLADSVARGARGLKVWKDLGLHVRDSRGRLVLPGDPLLSPLWEQAAELAVPVAIHTADPVAFFEPVDERNERLEELIDHPEWSFADPAFPRFSQLMSSLEALVAAHPRTRFIGLHAGCNAEDIAWIARMLDTYPNLMIDIAARIAELGRQPRRTRALILRHPGRVLFGTDLIPPQRETYEIYFRFLETDDEFFSYSPYDPPPTGRWFISALNLPAEVLRLVYSENARRLIRSAFGSGGPDVQVPQ